MFIKRDESFECAVCHKTVEKLRYTSRDHCNYCLYSLHVDVLPGDRINPCKGLLRPMSIEITARKEQIVYRCLKCGATVKNIVAEDDNREKLYEIASDFAKGGGNS